MTMRMASEMDKDVSGVLYSEEMLAEKIAEMGAQISRDYAGKNLLLSFSKSMVVMVTDAGHNRESVSFWKSKQIRFPERCHRLIPAKKRLMRSISRS